MFEGAIVTGSYKCLENDIFGSDLEVEPKMRDKSESLVSVWQERLNASITDVTSEPHLDTPKEEVSPAMAMEGQELTNTTISRNRGC